MPSSTVHTAASARRTSGAASALTASTAPVLVSYALTGSYSRYGTTYTFMGMSQVSDPQPGDICTSWSHCGIYIGGGQMIHAPTFGQTVCVSSVQSDMIIVRPW